MRILISIGHPAHVHYFKNFIKIMKKRGHEFMVVAIDKSITHQLLKYYKIPFISRKNYPPSLIGKFLRIPFTDLFFIKKAKRYKPDLMIGISGTHISHAGKTLRIPSVVLDDTDHADLAHWSYKSFSTNILTPNCFKKDFGSKHIRFNGYLELCYLHPKIFKPDRSINKVLNIVDDEKYVILRFVSWNASHDKGYSGLSLEMKYSLVKELSKHARVFISSEGELPEKLKRYQIRIKPEKMHSALYYCSLVIGESGTMTSECAVLGVPAIQISGLPKGTIGTLEELENYGLVKLYQNYSEDVLNYAIKIIRRNNTKKVWKTKRDKMLSEKIDVNGFLIWFIENYPKSVKKIKENQSYLEKFKH